MNPRISSAIKTLLSASGFYARRLSSVTFPGLVVLCYHGIRARGGTGQPFEPLQVPVDTFEQQCRVVRKYCDPIGADQLIAALDGGAPLPPRAVLLTFDDGYRSVLERAVPILRRYDIPAIVMVCSDPIARGRPFWYDAVAVSLGESEVDRLKTVPFADWRAAIGGFDAPAGGELFAPLSIADLQALAATDGIEIGGHSLQHPILSNASLDEQHRQVADDKRALEAWIDRPLRFFSYPNGRAGVDYTRATCDIVERCGYRAAFTTESAYATARSDRYELPRFLMLDSITAPALAHRLTFGWANGG
jgi:peptidoglycan/xylan/chitin deacetylase (PgdA/CDA1 family)